MNKNQELYARLHERGLEILAFPCDQFGHQEPGANEEIQQFCQLNYGVTFPVFAKIAGSAPGYHFALVEPKFSKFGPYCHCFSLAFFQSLI
jgi:glutathione peroxidase-family protein